MHLSSRAPLLRFHYRNFIATMGSSADPFPSVELRFSLISTAFIPNQGLPNFDAYSFPRPLDPYPAERLTFPSSIFFPVNHTSLPCVSLRSASSYSLLRRLTRCVFRGGSLRFMLRLQGLLGLCVVPTSCGGLAVYFRAFKLRVAASVCRILLPSRNG